MRIVYCLAAIVVVLSSAVNRGIAADSVLVAVIQRGHSDRIISVALSEDGKYLVTGSGDCTAILWEMATGKNVQTYRGALGDVHSVALTADHKYVFTGSVKGVMKFEAGSGKLIKTFPVINGTKMAISADGHVIVAGSANKVAQVWNTTTGNDVPLAWHEKRVTGVAITSDGSRVLTGSEDGTAILWDSTSAKKLQMFEEHKNEVTAVALSGDGKYALTGSRDHTAILWDATTGQKVRQFATERQQFNGSDNRINSVALSRDCKLVVAGYVDGTADIWNAATGVKLMKLQEESDVWDVALTSDSKTLVTCAKIATLWDVPSGQPLRRFQGNADTLAHATLVENGKRLAITSALGRVAIWDAPSAKILADFQIEINFQSERTISGGTRLLAAAYENPARIEVLETSSGKKLRVLEGFTESVASLAFSSDGKYVAAGGGDKSTALWETETGKLIHIFSGHSRRVCAVALTSDGKRLVTGSWDNSAILWDIATGKQIHVYEGRNAVSSIALSRNGTFAVLAGPEGGPIVWDLETGKTSEFKDGHDGLTQSVLLAGDDAYIVSSSDWDKTAIIWETKSGRKLQTFTFTKGCQAIVPVGLDLEAKLLWAMSGGDLLFLDMATSKERGRLVSVDDGKGWLTVTPDGLFEGSEGAEKHISYREEDTLRLIDDQVTRQRFHRPALLARIWRGEQAN